MPLLQAGIQEAFSWAFDRDGVVWASGASRDVYRLDTRLALNRNQKFDIQIESVKSPSEEFSGAKSPSGTPGLPYQDNELTFAFAAPSFEEETAFRQPTG